MLGYIAYTIYDRELGCGCEESIIVDVYDHTGNRPMLFTTKESAENAAKAKCNERGHDRWNVLPHTD